MRSKTSDRLDRTDPPIITHDDETEPSEAPPRRALLDELPDSQTRRTGLMWALARGQGG
jgi:hypothetical protein